MYTRFLSLQKILNKLNRHPLIRSPESFGRVRITGRLVQCPRRGLQLGPLQLPGGGGPHFGNLKKRFLSDSGILNPDKHCITGRGDRWARQQRLLHAGLLPAEGAQDLSQPLAHACHL